MKHILTPIRFSICFMVTLFLWSCNEIDIYENQITTENDIKPTRMVTDYFEATNYYWYKDKKMFLKKIPERQYIVFKKQDKEKLSAFSKNNNSFRFLKEEKELNLPGVALYKNDSEKFSDLLWGIMEVSHTTVNFTSTPEILYNSPFYLSAEGEEVGISHLFYVKLKTPSDKEKLITLANKHQIEIVGNNKYLSNWYTLACTNSSTGDALQMANLFYETGLFEASEPDIMAEYRSFSHTFSRAILPNDTYFNRQWNLNGNQSINWLSAYELAQGNNIKVAVIDEGIQRLHPDLPNVSPLYDTYFHAWYTTQVYGPHGTACAGIIGAATNNNKGIVGISPKVQLLDISASFEAYPNQNQDLASGITIAANNADIISNSWGGGIRNSLIDDAIYYAFFIGRNGKGSVVIFASGNSNRNVSYPANSYSDVIAVGAINKNGKRLNVSNYGTDLDVVAPGEYIPTTDLLYGGGYSPTSEYFLEFGMTSAACPHVAGVVALMLSVNNKLSYSEVKEIIEKTARKVGGYNYTTVSGRPNGTWNIEMGYGLIDAYAAVMEAKRRL